jgi:Raf kinase inhibitor-like YbhB/YbcL family protein
MRIAILVFAALFAAGCKTDNGTKSGAGGQEEPAVAEAKPLAVTSAAFAEGEAVPKKHSGEGEDVSPPLAWSGAPESTKSFAILCDDPDAPRPRPWVHWIVFNLPAGTTSLPEGAPDLTEGANSWGKAAYGGPMPPPGHGVHHYHFQVFALDRMLDLEAGATKEALLAAMEGSILARGELVGTYERK